MIALVPIVAALLAFGLYYAYKRWRDQSVLSRPFPSDWLAIVERRLPIYGALSQEEQSQLQELIKFFIDRKDFYGCAGLTITDEIRVTIAAEACLLLLNKKRPIYPKLTAILVYPTAFRVEREQHQANGTVASGPQGMLGESWDNGRVILSWDDVEKGARDFTDGHNVVLHEFAHQLDAESGSTNGAPPLRRNSYGAWSRVLSDNFEDLDARSIAGLDTVMDEYGTTNPAEFFAVATETFFEKPHQLSKRRPALYEELKTYYQLDPRDWHR
jgi:Mlc titration factor MtfA (ptsG expression regulator)